ncbi:MAG: hypothetical protein JXR65_11195 [Bacteroidales bacterium]|nr:hypothetical protein [Bacteroidales bacterium]
MKKTVYIILMITALIIFSNKLNAQTYVAGDSVPTQNYNVGLIDSNHPYIGMQFNTTTAGLGASPATNSDLFVRLSATARNYGHAYSGSGTISACITAGTVPQGTVFTLISAPCTTTNSGGSLGTPITTPIILSTTDQNIVTNIGTCYTGTNDTDGYQMTFSWYSDNYKQIHSQNTTITITFTITVAFH